MAAGITLADAEKYFLGMRVDVESYPSEVKSVVVKVEKID